MNRIWKVGLVGAGYILEAHAKALKCQSNVQIAGICDLSIERARQAAHAYGIAKAYCSIDEMLASDIDVVHVLTPPDTHTNIARRCLLAGKHVFLEKPMGLDAASCQELVALAKERFLKLAVNHNFLFLPSYERLRNEARDGTLGRVDQITINWLYPLGLVQFGPFNSWMLRQPQNLFFELGPHLLAFMIDLAGPLDTLQVDTFRSIDLPGGSRVYRRWHIHGQSGVAGVDLNLSVVPGFTDRSISVRSHAANARCDFDRDVYFRDEPSGSGMLFDNFFTTCNVAKQIIKNAFGNLLKSIRSTLSKAPASNPFGESIERSVRRFYETVETELDPRLDGAFGVKVIQACEAIVARAEFPDSPFIDGGDCHVGALPPITKPKVLVIGATGFIGKYLVKALVSRRLGVRAVTRSLSSGQIALAGLPVELVQGDLNDEAFLDSAMEGVDVVYDLAKAVGKKWEDYYNQDVLVTRKIAERALANNIKRFIYTGTIDSYYSADPKEVITSDTPLDPQIRYRNHYARSKAECEGLLLKLHHEQGLPVVIFRPGIVIGEGCSPAHWGIGMFQSATRMQFWGDGVNKLPLVLVEDVAEALALGLDKPGIEGHSFLLTDKPLLSGKEYVDAVSEASGTAIRAEATPLWKFYVVDAVKEIAKHLIRHPNRKTASYRDWASRSHRARYDSTKTTTVLGWIPVGSRDVLMDKGIFSAVREFYR